MTEPQKSPNGLWLCKICGEELVPVVKNGKETNFLEHKELNPPNFKRCPCVFWVKSVYENEEVKFERDLSNKNPYSIYKRRNS